MKSTEQHIEDLHFQHKLWESEASFYRDELKIYQKQVEDVSNRNSSSEVKDKVKHFENQFKAKNEELESLFHEISSHEHDLVAIEKNQFKGTGGENSEEHTKMLKKFNTFKNKYTELKNEFMLFLEDWM